MGDIVGENGLQKASQVLPELKKKDNIDFIIEKMWQKEWELPINYIKRF